MNTNTKKARDADTFSTGGLRIRSSFAFLPLIAHDHINKAMDEKLRSSRDEGKPGADSEAAPFWGRLWLRARRRAA